MRLKELFRTKNEGEPVGIVIADGGRGDAAPRFSAFVWGPEPEDELLVSAVHEELVVLA